MRSIERSVSAVIPHLDRRMSFETTPLPTDIKTLIHRIQTGTPSQALQAIEVLGNQASSNKVSIAKEVIFLFKIKI